jgi:hypothetical protein
MIQDEKISENKSKPLLLMNFLMLFHICHTDKSKQILF